MREPPNIPEATLLACLRDEYGIDAISIEFLPLGLDLTAAVYRVEGRDSVAYLMKAKQPPFDETSLRVPAYLRAQGVEAAVAPVATLTRALWAEVGEWTITLFPFIEGHSGWDSARNDAYWRALGATMIRVHAVEAPAAGLRLRRESFEPGIYAREVQTLEAGRLAKDSGDEVQKAFQASWGEHRPTIHHALDTLDALSGALRQQAGPYVICHGDLHPGNVIRDATDSLHLIDWADALLAPKERDFIFLGEQSPFYAGYGAQLIDWTALTYFCWEGVIQDVIEYAKQAFEESGALSTRPEALNRFGLVFSPGYSVDRAQAAAAHLQPGVV